MKNVFQTSTTDELLGRLDQLNQNTPPLWGKMDAAQMLAHCNVMYEKEFENKHPKPGPFQKFLLKLIVKPMVTNNKPFPKNSRTAPEFVIKSDKNFQHERRRLVDHILKVRDLGEGYFDGRNYVSFGKMTKEQWSTMFYKHLDHHFKQFGI